MSSNSCNEDATAEVHCKGCNATAAMNCKVCNEAAAAETNSNGCTATAEKSATVALKLQMQKFTATNPLQLQQ